VAATERERGRERETIRLYKINSYVEEERVLTQLNDTRNQINYSNE